jgi:tetratricopeptide (TPR) repeat protein
VLYFRKELEASRISAEKAIGLNPMDTSTAGYMGQTIAYSGDWQRGVAISARAVALNPNHPEWYWYPAFLDAYRKEDYRAALTIALKINMPASPLTYVARAIAHAQLGNAEAARKAVDGLLALRSDFGQVARDEMSKM